LLNALFTIDRLALCETACHGSGMKKGPSNAMQAGGCLLAVCILGGAFIGALFRQSSIGFVTGTALGLAAAIVLWLVDRRRRS
jgi:hypothetical protein